MHANRFVIATLLAASAGVVVAPAVAHADAKRSGTQIQVNLSRSEYIKLGSRISRVSVAGQEIADVAAFPPDQVLITGKRIGSTTATVWSGNDVEVLIIEVTYPLKSAREALRKALPNAKNLDVRQAGAALVISGDVDSPDKVVRAEEIARGFITGGTDGAKVINMLRVPGDQQVQIEVSFAEVSRSALREIGMNFWARKAEWAGGLLAPTMTLDQAVPSAGPASGIGGLQTSATSAVPLLQAPLSGTFGAVFSSTIGNFPFSATLSLLSNRGYARVLTEPTLVALSGESASFLVGGEFPVPLPQTLGQIAVDYKKFGIQLEFTPTVMADTIQLAMGVTVSDIDQSIGVKLASVNVPGLTERHANTTIRLKDGQSFVIAGLLSDRVRSIVDKVPWLGDIPVLGTLFRSTSYRREETELLVVVTAKRVKPLTDRPRLPGEHENVDPSDLELFLLGSAESLPTPKKRRKRRKKSSRDSTNKTDDDSGDYDFSDEVDETSDASDQRVAPVGAIGFKR